MNLSRKWLSEFVDITATNKEFAEALTISGSKVETSQPMDAEIKNVVVGKVVTMAPHENSDHMFICQIDIGKTDLVQIVTGAQNVKVGDLVPAALHDSYLPGDIHITAGQLRGVQSCGMLCSLAELKLTLHDEPEAEENGIWILDDSACIGQDMNEVIGNDDTVVEFEITNNRPDCFSLIGLAREVAATYDVPLKLHDPVVRGGGDGDLCQLLDVEVPAEDLCRRYSAKMVRNVTIAPSPKWMRQRLRASGIRPINNIVDITNYIMVEYGQPMHAFDYRYVKDGKIIVRCAEDGEVLTTLDGVERPLKAGMLVIADETKPVGLAGIMGGENSEITANTVDVVFESANFVGSSVRQSALALGMRTDASSKFEKNLDPMSTIPALNRACELVELLGAGQVLDGTIDVLNYVEPPFTLPLEVDAINNLLGLSLTGETMTNYLARLEIMVEDGMIQVPSWRSDLRCMADIAEEVARMYGYNNIPTTQFKGVAVQGGYSDEALLERKVGVQARAMGFSEIVTYSFGSPNMFDMVRMDKDSPLRNTLKLLNPLGEDTSVMRTTALPAMMEILSRNFAYQNKVVKLYEIAKRYLPVQGEKLPDEPKTLMLGAYGDGADFFSLKGELGALFHILNVKAVQYVADTTNPSYHPGRCANIMIDGIVMGVMGQVHPLVCGNYGIDLPVYVAEIDFTAIQTVLAPEATYKALPKFPTVTRDLALVCDEGLSVAQIETCISNAGGSLLQRVTLFDIYRGVGVADGKKSVAFSLQLRDDSRTLTEEDCTAVTKAVLLALESELSITLR